MFVIHVSVLTHMFGIRPENCIRWYTYGGMAKQYIDWHDQCENNLYEFEQIHRHDVK
jgi:hypothetical protein